MHAVIQVPPDGVVGSRDCCSHSFAACTVDVTVCFSRQTVSALTSGLLHYSAQPTSCWLHLAYFDQKISCWRISCHRHPQLSPSLPWEFFVSQKLSQHKHSCNLSQHEVRSCTAERLVDASPFFLLLDTSLFEQERDRDCFYFIIIHTYEVGFYSRRHPIEIDAGTRPFASLDAPISQSRRRRERMVYVCVCVCVCAWWLLLLSLLEK